MLPKKIYLTPKNITLFVVCIIVILIIIIGVTFVVSLSIFKSILIHKIKNTSEKYANTLSDEIIYIMKHQCDQSTEYLTFDSHITENCMKSISEEHHDKYFYDYNLAKFLILLCQNVSISNCINPNDMIIPSSFNKNLVTTLYSNTKYTNNIVIYGYLFFDDNTKTTFLIWSGTATARMWISDFNFRLHSYPQHIINDSDVKVHEGYLNTYLKFRKQILEAWNTIYKEKSSYFIIAGHSLGGALTYISAFDLMKNNKSSVPILVHSFASPRVGNAEFVSQYNKLSFLRSIRIFNTEDIIPYVPLPIIQNVITGKSYLYEHCDSVSIPFTVNLGSNVANHIESYVNYLPK